MRNDLNNWVKYIGTQNVPVFNSTIQAVLKLTTDEKSTCKQLADTILKNPALTTRVIRVANSPYYNRINTRLTNLRRIVLLIGFSKITEICFTLSILDSMVDNRTRKHVFKITAKSYHAAVQARSIAEIYQVKDPDMVYLAALLYNIGEIAFWSLSGKSGKLISDLLGQVGISKEKAEENVLGTTFRKLSCGLATEWNLSELLKDALNNPSSSSKEIKSIMYGYNIAESILNKSTDFTDVSSIIAHESSNSINDISKIITSNISSAQDTFLYYVN